MEFTGIKDLDNIIYDYVEKMEKYEMKKPILDEIKKIKYDDKYNYFGQTCSIRYFNNTKTMYMREQDDFVTLGDIDIYSYDKNKKLTFCFLYKFHGKYTYYKDDDDFD